MTEPPLVAAQPFHTHIQFAIPMWCAQHAGLRIEAALRRIALTELTFTQHIGDHVLSTLSLPCGTIGEAFRGELPAYLGFRAAYELVEGLHDLGPVFAEGPPRRGVVVRTFTQRFGIAQALRVVYDDTQASANGATHHDL
ncbi:hypothetical protein JOF53_006457 [Crossiella equi]|uniref:Uncharacterized protein n=1 Tax=Crossiella equi TaxID=130796 RepID=A0ABS5ALY5_9PSEU|nr:hypothetical protein [Crossiella equi]MBP2477585.1 hypothetical protein [Crossiella equi]